jgi:hypothetical protein
MIRRRHRENTFLGSWWRFGLLVLLHVGRADAQEAGSSVSILNAMPGSSLTIRGSTTIGARWHCTTTELESRLAVVKDAAAPGRLPDVRGVTIHVSVATLRCQTGAMERAMRHALKADRDTAAQVIEGRFEIADTVPPASADERDLLGALRVAGVERQVFLRSTILVQADGSMIVRSVVPLTLSTFGITPPKVLFGAVRARDAITVEVDLRFPNSGP